MAPPYGPELNPIERVWRDLKDDLAWLQFPDLEAQQVDVGDLWQTYEGPHPPSPDELCILGGSH
jgi:transposase